MYEAGYIVVVVSRSSRRRHPHLRGIVEWVFNTQGVHRLKGHVARRVRPHDTAASGFEMESHWGPAMEVKHGIHAVSSCGFRVPEMTLTDEVSPRLLCQRCTITQQQCKAIRTTWEREA